MPESADAPCVNSMDFSILTMTLLATSVIVIGAHESARNMADRESAAADGQDSSGGGGGAASGGTAAAAVGEEEDEDGNEFVMSWQMAALYAVFASAGLVLLYFFIDSLMTLLTVLITIIAAVSGFYLACGGSADPPCLSQPQHVEPARLCQAGLSRAAAASRAPSRWSRRRPSVLCALGSPCSTT